ncbi:MAG: DNA polymerase [Patescibacteria group bacterium]
MTKKGSKTGASKKQLVVLLDSHAIIHRAYHALPDFASSKGIPTGAIYGLSTMLMGIIDKFNPDYVIACYDLPQPTHRHEAYDAYKAGRKKADEALVSQLISSRGLFEAFNIPMYDKPGFEADDMLGTIVEQILKNKAICETADEKGKITKSECGDNLDVMIASGDMDTLQLIHNDKVKVFTLKKGIKDTVIYNEEAVRERFGFGPELLPDYKGLRGDPSDNIIGIAGIGEKTATILISKFGTIEEIYKVLKKSPEKIKEAGITERVFELLKNGEEEAIFSKMLATIRRDAPVQFMVPAKTWRETFDPVPIDRFFREMEFRSLSARLKQVADRILGTKGLGFAETGYIDSDMVKAPANFGAISPEKSKELTIMLWVVNSNVSYPTMEDVFSYTGATSVEQAEQVLRRKLVENNLEQLYEQVEKPLIPIVDQMEKNGVKIDKDFFKKLSEKYHIELEKLGKSIWKEAGVEFNIASPKQLGEILFDKMGLVPESGVRMKKTAGGARSTKESELEKMRGSHPIIDMILQHRELSKLLSTYIDTLPTMADEKDRIHSTFHQAGTTTGRIASNDPNLQNIPIKTELGRQVRHGFVAEKGYKLMSFDYSQIELRIAAILSKDQKMIDIFKKGTDIHTGVAAEVFKVSEKEVTKEMRRQAKVINFGILFGMGVNALKMNLGSTRAEAQEFLNRYFETFQELAVYLERVKIEAKRDGYTTTMFGRRRYFEGLKSALPFIRAAAERMAINAPIQGTEADLVKIAMVCVYDLIIKRGWKSEVKLLMQVHDELVYEVKESLVPIVAEEVRRVMESIMTKQQTFDVPIVSSANAGDNWGEMEEVKID